MQRAFQWPVGFVVVVVVVVVVVGVHPVQRGLIGRIIGFVLERIQDPVLAAVDRLGESRSVDVPRHARSGIADPKGKGHQVVAIAIALGTAPGIVVASLAGPAGWQLVFPQEVLPFPGVGFPKEVPGLVGFGRGVLRWTGGDLVQVLGQGNRPPVLAKGIGTGERHGEIGGKGVQDGVRSREFPEPVVSVGRVCLCLCLFAVVAAVVIVAAVAVARRSFVVVIAVRCNDQWPGVQRWQSPLFSVCSQKVACGDGFDRAGMVVSRIPTRPLLLLLLLLLLLFLLLLFLLLSRTTNDVDIDNDRGNNEGDPNPL